MTDATPKDEHTYWYTKWTEADHALRCAQEALAAAHEAKKRIAKERDDIAALVRNELDRFDDDDDADRWNFGSYILLDDYRFAREHISYWFESTAGLCVHIDGTDVTVPNPDGELLRRLDEFMGNG